jgi:hypothetical protein
MRIWIHFFLSMRIRIQGAKLMRIQRRYKRHFERLEIRFFVHFGQFPYSWIQIRIPRTDLDPDPGEPNQCGSGYETLKNDCVEMINRFKTMKTANSKHHCLIK